MYTLPKGYLSYSALDLFLKNPKQYRRKYYENAYEPTSPEMSFGKKIALLLENRDDVVSHIKQYSHPEYQLQVEIEGVPVYGFIDSFDVEKHAFLEYKTGHAPWDAVRVRKHLQLPFYAVCIEQIFGHVHPECELIWMETRKVEVPQIGLVTHGEHHGIELTGRVESFVRKIPKWERKRMRELIAKTAREITDDYCAYKKEKNL